MQATEGREKRASQDFHISGFSFLTLFVQVYAGPKKVPVLLKGARKIKETKETFSVPDLWSNFEVEAFQDLREVLLIGSLGILRPKKLASPNPKVMAFNLAAVPMPLNLPQSRLAKGLIFGPKFYHQRRCYTGPISWLSSLMLSLLSPVARSIWPTCLCVLDTQSEQAHLERQTRS